jgi:dipeptidyl-peptidase-4
VATGQERLVADPAAIGADEHDLPPQERARRERAREQAGGIVSYATDAALRTAVFPLSGRVFAVDLDGRGPAGPRELAVRTPALDARPDPAGRMVAYVNDGALHVADLDPAAGPGPADRVLADPAGAPGVTFGLAEFVAAEEMGRFRGYWWAPDGTALLVARVDETPVNRWHISDPANPDRPPVPVAYPAAGTPNADVSLVLAALDGGHTPVEWDRAAFPYLVTASWDEGHEPLVVAESRDQRRMRILSVDPATGATAVLREDTDPHWLDVVPGVPAWTSDGRIVWTADQGGARRLLVATRGELAGRTAPPVTPVTLQVRDILGVDGDTVLFTASGDPAEIALWSYGPAGLAEVSEGGGLSAGQRAGGTTVVTRRSLGQDDVTVRVLRARAGDGEAAGPAGGRDEVVARIDSRAERPNLPAPRPAIQSLGRREIRSALLFPSWHEPGSGRLPVLLDPYGGPHAQRVLAARSAFLTSQWFAEQGFAVLVADGRGTPGRGPDWERAVAGDLAGPVLEDQVDALQAAAGQHADLDLSRVAIRGWSFGGYLAALAVLRRPDVFHAAIAGAPVTEWQLYDTFYTERYLGHPDDNKDAYDACSLVADTERLARRGQENGAGGAGHRPFRPLMLIHGLADDNVVVAHTLRLSSGLLAAGYPHTALPLSGVTHMTPQEVVAENLLLVQLGFLRDALGLAGSEAARNDAV